MDRRILRSVTSDAKGVQWLRALGRAGVRSKDGDGIGGEMYLAARLLAELDDAFLSTVNTRTFAVGLPRGWWFFVPCAFSAGLVASAVPDQYEDRLKLWAAFLGLFGLIAAYGLFWLFSKRMQINRVRMQEQARFKAERNEARAGLVALRDRLFEAIESEVADPPKV